MILKGKTGSPVRTLAGGTGGAAAWRASALVGALVWLVWLVLGGAERTYYPAIAAPLLLAVLVLVPLGLALVPPPGLVPQRLLRGLQPLAALAALGAFALPAGPGAAALALPWALFAALVALAGLDGLARRHSLGAWAVCLHVGQVYLPVGGGWLVLSRLGARPLDFGDTIVLLTAVHFHYAGFLAPLLVGLAGRALPPAASRARHLYAWLSGGVLLGPPLLAAGITFSRPLEFAAALLLAGSLAGAMLVAVWRVAPRLAVPARLLLTVSTLAVLFPMILAVLYALGQLTGRPLVTLAQMVPLHGWVNALGFALCGLLAWTLVPEVGHER